MESWDQCSHQSPEGGSRRLKLSVAFLLELASWSLCQCGANHGLGDTPGRERGAATAQSELGQHNAGEELFLIDPRHIT